MNIIYRQAEPSDAAALIDYIRTIGGESDNLSFDGSGIPVTIEQEEAFLRGMAESDSSVMLVALDGGEIVGNASVSGLGGKRFGHRCSLAVTVRKDHWHMGIATALMTRLIEFARNAGMEIIELEVRSDNERAKALYRRLGFVSFGTYPKFFKINGEYFDADCMTLDMRASNV